MMLARLVRILQVALLLLATKILLAILLIYPQYFPADFSSDFLHGRGDYFWNGYHLVFYSHILAGPLSLILGGYLLWSGGRLANSSSSGRARHRRLGVLQIGLVLIGVVPSGAAMAFYAESTTAGSGFFVLALLTGWAAGKGWYAIACQRSLTQHQRWMTRCTLLLFSALILRIMGGLATIAELNPSTAYAAAAWASWALPCLGYEWFCRQRRLASLEQRSTEALAQAAFGPTK